MKITLMFMGGLAFTLPLAVLPSLPPGVFGSFLLLKLMGLANDIYAQVGLVMLVGLISGVIIVPGLHYVFGSLVEGKSLICEEEDTSVSEEIAHHV